MMYLMACVCVRVFSIYVLTFADFAPTLCSRVSFSTTNIVIINIIFIIIILIIIIIINFINIIIFLIFIIIIIIISIIIMIAHRSSLATSRAAWLLIYPRSLLFTFWTPSLNQFPDNS